MVYVLFIDGTPAMLVDENMPEAVAFESSEEFLTAWPDYDYVINPPQFAPIKSSEQIARESEYLARQQRSLAISQIVVSAGGYDWDGNPDSRALMHQAIDTATRNSIPESKWRDANGIERIVTVPLLQQILDMSVMRQGEIMGIANA